MRSRMYVLFLALVAAMLAMASPSTAATVDAVSVSPAVVHPDAPYGPCGDHFMLYRSGSTIRVVGVALDAFSHEYMAVYVSDSYGHGWGPYPATPTSGANFSFNSGRTTKQNFNVDLLTSGRTLCTDRYYA